MLFWNNKIEWLSTSVLHKCNTQKEFTCTRCQDRTVSWVIYVNVYSRAFFYSCLLSDLAFQWPWGWRWPCFDADSSVFVTYMHLVSIRTCFTQQKQWSLYQNNVTSSFAAIRKPGYHADNRKMIYTTKNTLPLQTGDYSQYANSMLL